MLGAGGRKQSSGSNSSQAPFAGLPLTSYCVSGFLTVHEQARACGLGWGPFAVTGLSSGKPYIPAKLPTKQDLVSLESATRLSRATAPTPDGQCGVRVGKTLVCLLAPQACCW